MTTTRRIPILLEAVELCPEETDTKNPRWPRESASVGGQLLKFSFKWTVIFSLICLSAGESVAQQNWLVPLRPETARQPLPPEATLPPDTSSSRPASDAPINTEIKGAFGFTLGEKINPRFKLYHDSHEKDLPYYKINPEVILTEKISIDYRVLITPGDRKVALIKAKCILESIHDVQSFSQRIQELILSKYGRGKQHVLPTKFGRKWFYSKPNQPTISINIEADSTTGIVYIQYSDEALVSEIRRDVWEKRVGKFNLSAL